MEYNKIISSKRREPTSLPGRNLTEELASDRSRILYTPPFRRLSQKAQVFSLESNAAVRNRITHSLEVSDVGRLIAYHITEELIRRRNIGYELQLPIMYAVESACLLHDIGNPPFGHFGESAIREWFGRNWEPSYKLSERMQREDTIPGNNKIWSLMSDFTEFDGNPQGLRIILRLQRERDPYGLNLTYTSILSLIKYVRSPSEERRDNGLGKKAGYFESEKEIVEGIKNALGIPLNARYPLAYIMEAADDIAYCISDIEDGIEKGILSAKDFFEELADEWSKIRVAGDPDTYPLGVINDAEPPAAKFFEFKTSYTRQAIDRAKDIYLESQDDLLSGSISGLFSGGRTDERAIKCLKNVARRRLFRSPEAENPELAGHRIILGLLDSFKPLLTCSTEQFKRLLHSKNNPSSVAGHGLDMHWRLFNKLPHKQLLAYEDQLAEFDGKGFPEWYFRAHMLVDYISGMTDGFALYLYQLLNGIKLK